MDIYIVFCIKVKATGNALDINPVTYHKAFTDKEEAESLFKKFEGQLTNELSKCYLQKVELPENESPPVYILGYACDTCGGTEWRCASCQGRHSVSEEDKL